MATLEENVKKLQGNSEELKINIFVPVSGYWKMAGKDKGKHKIHMYIMVVHIFVPNSSVPSKLFDYMNILTSTGNVDVS